ncbi:MAG: ATP-binding protein [Chitinophagaceae bacterium]
MHENQEIFFITIIGIALGLLLVGFIVTILFLYQRRQRNQEVEIDKLKDKYEREALRSQLEIQENAFKTMGQELHDNIGQMLSVAKLTLSILPIEQTHPAYDQLQNSMEVLNKAIVDLSNLTKSLHTDRITQIGLSDSIRFELYALKKAGILEIFFHVDGTEEYFNEQKSVFLFRMFQESLNNILKHSKATQVKVNLSYFEDLFVMEISDNGVGFNVTEKKQSTNSHSGVGLKSIFNRAKLIGADLTIQSDAKQGTVIRIELPMKEE